MEEKLFIPEAAAEYAESTLRPVIVERNFFALFADQHEGAVRHEYIDNIASFCSEIDKGMELLERMMRDPRAWRRLEREQASNC